jgi:hypothetical protein
VTGKLSAQEGINTTVVNDIVICETLNVGIKK